MYWAFAYEPHFAGPFYMLKPDVLPQLLSVASDNRQRIQLLPYVVEIGRKNPLSSIAAESKHPEGILAAASRRFPSMTPACVLLGHEQRLCWKYPFDAIDMAQLVDRHLCQSARSKSNCDGFDPIAYSAKSPDCRHRKRVRPDSPYRK